MKYLFEYYPYRIHRYIIPFVVILFGACLLISFFYFHPLFITSVLLLPWIIKSLYDTIHTKILFYEHGICVYERKKATTYTWEQFRCGYRTTNFKGHHFLLLTSGKLVVKQVRKYTNKGATTSKVSIDNIVVFPVEDSKYTQELDDFISSNVTIVRI